MDEESHYRANNAEEVPVENIIAMRKSIGKMVIDANCNPTEYSPEEHGLIDIFLAAANAAASDINVRLIRKRPL
jgi:hypothetical protein